MKYLSRVTVTTIALFALGVAVSTGDAIGQTAKDLVGVWTPVSVQAFGPNPKGLLIFESNGRFSLQLMKAELPKYASNNRNEGTAEENKATVQGAISYYGTYSVSGTDLIFHVEACSFPNWTGTDQKRKAGDLPIQQPAKFDFVVNLRTAKTMGFTLAPAILVRADEVIE